MAKAVTSKAKGLPIEGLPQLERDVLSLLRSLHDAYSDIGFQAEIAQIRETAGGNALRLITALGPAAAQVQAPVFKKFGLPAGQRGVMLMKMGVKALSQSNTHVRGLAGDLRELLGLQREEEDTVTMMEEAKASFAKLVAKVERAPLDVRGPLAEALRLPYKASAEQIAREVPNIKERAREIAEKHLGQGRAELIGPGKVLPTDMEGAADDELRSKLVEMFEHYLQKMFARVVTDVESFTKPPSEFRCAWADGIVGQRHAAELWGPQKRGPVRPGSEWLSLGVGVTVVDGAVERGLAVAARGELERLEAAGAVTASRDPCNVGARSVWLHFDTPEERGQVPPTLLKLCLRLAGLPAALERVAASCPPSSLSAPRLRVHPHVMAATYCRGAEYHCHKDSYGGTDNQRMLTVLLYLNDGWQPGDAGELRVFAARGGEGGADESHWVDIAPLCGRLVLFRSREVWHAVREPREQRWALTLWVMAD